MPKRIIKSFDVGGESYFVSLRDAYANEAMHLSLTFRANFGTRSVCRIVGLRNFDYYRHYGWWNRVPAGDDAQTIEITPRLIARLISFARNNGWSPDTERTTRQLTLSNAAALALLSQ